MLERVSGSRFLRRRTVDRLLRDPLDWLWRAFHGRSYLPPYSMRQFVGGARDFEAAGVWFVDELFRLGLLRPGVRILDLGCGCGRIALALARDERVGALSPRYDGLDVDARAIAWCSSHIERGAPSFRFTHADVRNDSYNPGGGGAVAEYRLPYEDASFDLALATSLFTHLRAGELTRYHAELARVLAPGGALFASYFFFDPGEEPAARRPIRFEHPVDAVSATANPLAPEDAIAFRRDWLEGLWAEQGFGLAAGPFLGLQDTAVLCAQKPRNSEPSA